MLYILLNKGLPVHITTETPYTGTPVMKTFKDAKGNPVVYDEATSRWEYKTLAEVEGLAMRLTAMTGKTYLGVTDGNMSFDIIEAPAIGDPVSYAFNGDYRPCGTITKITKGWRITTSTGKVFNRRKSSAGWLMVGGTWSMVSGHIDERSREY